MNKKFGKLTPIKIVGRKFYTNIWECKCECGKTTEAWETNLKTGKTKSCGCQKGRFSHRECYTKFYKRFFGIIDRCTNKKAKAYKNYGGRGIKCLWESYEEFKKDMYPSFLKHIEKVGERQTSIDRINNDGDYCKENCRWATKLEQAANMRRSKKQ